MLGLLECIFILCTPFTFALGWVIGRDVVEARKDARKWAKRDRRIMAPTLPCRGCGHRYYPAGDPFCPNCMGSD